jgi:hypothetical protein
MNFFPNLQIHVYPAERPNVNTRRNRNETVNTTNSSTNTASNLLNTMLQSLRRANTVDLVSTSVSTDPEDVQIYFGYETLQGGSPAPLPNGLQMQDLNSYTELYINEELSDTICSICRNNFASNDICRKINNCNHSFHQTCVDSWLVRNQTCPMCRNFIIPRSQN